MCSAIDSVGRWHVKNKTKLLIMEQLKELIQKRKELKAVEKKHKDFESPKKYLEARKLRKKTEKAIFKILEDEDLLITKQYVVDNVHEEFSHNPKH